MFETTTALHIFTNLTHLIKMLQMQSHHMISNNGKMPNKLDCHLGSDQQCEHVVINIVILCETTWCHN